MICADLDCYSERRFDKLQLYVSGANKHWHAADWSSRVASVRYSLHLTPATRISSFIFFFLLFYWIPVSSTSGSSQTSDVSSTTLDNSTFIVGVTNLDPTVYPPSEGNYYLCGQAEGGLIADGSTVNVDCANDIPPSKYIFVQKKSNGSMSFCELEVYSRGNQWLWLLSAHEILWKNDYAFYNVHFYAMHTAANYKIRGLHGKYRLRLEYSCALCP